MWPDRYFVARFWNNRMWSPNSPGGGGVVSPIQNIAALASNMPRLVAAWYGK